MIYTIGRTPKGRAALMHEMHPNPDWRNRTLCGRDQTGTSRALFAEPIPEVMCLRCTVSREKRDRLGLP